MLCLKTLAHGASEEAKLRRNLESNYERFFGKTLEVFTEKEHLVKQSLIDRPATGEEVAYSHKKAVHPSLSIAKKLLEQRCLLQRERT